VEAPPLQTHPLRDDARGAARITDFSTTAIHGLDAVRYLAGADYAQARFRYRELPELGPGVADIFVDAVIANGATAHLAFCPVAGAVLERATAQAHGHTLVAHVPMWGGPDSPGRLWHLAAGRLEAEVTGTGDGDALFELGGFYAQTAAFLEALAQGRPPSPSFRESRQSVEMAQCIRQRCAEYRP
jgi:predicted dehydrogenase